MQVTLLARFRHLDIVVQRVCRLTQPVRSRKELVVLISSRQRVDDDQELQERQLIQLLQPNA